MPGRFWLRLLQLATCIGLGLMDSASAIAWPGFEPVPGFPEEIRWTRLPSGIRVCVDSPVKLNASRRVLVIYATPNGSTIEQTLGCAATKGQDYRFDLQNVLAQVRRWREVNTDEEILLSVVQAPQLSWPGFRTDHPKAAVIIRDLVATLTDEFQVDRVILACHSGGGSFVLGYLMSVETVPQSIDRILLLDANYSFTEEQHGKKLLTWLRGGGTRKLVVMAYDDREIMLNGKKVIGPDGGTYRATNRMVNWIRPESELVESIVGDFHQTTALDGQIRLLVHPNPENKILHTAMVGEMNGLLEGLAWETPHAADWGKLGGPRAYRKWVQPTPLQEPAVPRATLAPATDVVRLNFPARPADSVTGSQFLAQIKDLPRRDREAASLQELARGNLPDFLRQLVVLRVDFTDATGTKHVAEFHVMPDYLAIGSNEDFFRIPLTPASAVKIADQVGGSLMTAKISDDIFAAATVKLEPRPLTRDRDAVATFYQHHAIIEEQWQGKPRGPLVAGIKKDLVLTNRLKEKPHKVAIYGWHQSDGIPIQPLYTGHVDWYVDYSHGVRLISNRIIVDGHPQTVVDVLKHSVLHKLLSDEGAIDVVEVRRAAEW